MHVFGAHRYDQARDCLEAAAAVDVLEGEDPGACSEVRCWMSPEFEVYVTDTACEGPLDFRDGTGDPEGTACARALAAYDRPDHGLCP